MLYRNKRTGAVIETPCRVSGGDWEPVRQKGGQTKAAAKEKPEAAE